MGKVAYNDSKAEMCSDMHKGFYVSPHQTLLVTPYCYKKSNGFILRHTQAEPLVTVQ